MLPPKGHCLIGVIRKLGKVSENKRFVGVVTIVVRDSRLLIKTVEWEDSRMAKDVERALTDIASEHGRLGPDRAVAYIAELKKSKRFQADVY